MRTFPLSPILLLPRCRSDFVRIPQIPTLLVDLKRFVGLKKTTLPLVIGVAVACLALVFMIASSLLSGDEQAETAPTAAAAIYSKEDIIAQQLTSIRNGYLDTFHIKDHTVSDEDILPLEGLSGVRVVILDQGMISDDGMKILATLPDLMHLRVRISIISDRGLGHLLGCENLRILNLPNSQLTDEGIMSLRQLPRLRQLRIGGDSVTELSYSIATLDKINALHLINVPVTDEGLKAIAAMPRLESLYLDSAQVTEAGWQWLFDHHPELHVHVDQRHHDRDPQYHEHASSQPD